MPSQPPMTPPASTIPCNTISGMRQPLRLACVLSISRKECRRRACDQPFEVERPIDHDEKHHKKGAPDNHRRNGRGPFRLAASWLRHCGPAVRIIHRIQVA